MVLELFYSGTDCSGSVFFSLVFVFLLLSILAISFMVVYLFDAGTDCSGSELFS